MANIFNHQSNKVVSGTSYDDNIQSRDARNVIILAGDGNDTVETEGISENIVIDLSNGNDSVFSESGDKISISGGKGNDSIYSRGDYATINTGAGNDSIRVGGYNNKIDMGDGNDSIFHDGGNYATINTGAGDDHVDNYSGSYNSSINTGDGNDTIKIRADKITLESGSGNDSIDNSGSKASITAGAGNDSVNNTGSDLKIDAGEGTDTVSNSGSNVTVESGAGNDSINNYGSNSRINGGDGNDRFLNWSNNVKIEGGAGNDSIANSENSENTEIFGGAGNDTIRETSKHGSTIDGGTGNDRISLVSGSKNAFIIYNAGDGDDTIYGFNETSTLRIGDGTNTYSTTKSGNDIIVGVERGKITLKGAANLSAVNIRGVYNSQAVIRGTNGADNLINSLPGAAIYGLGGNDSIKNYGDSVTVDGGAGNDSIYNYRGTNVLIYGDNGDDTIKNIKKLVTIESGNGNNYISNEGSNVIINVGDGNDTVWNYGSDVTINGGDGNDYIHSDGYTSTISAGKGNDTISLFHIDRNNRNLILYDAGDGNDYIKGFKSNSTLDIGGANYASIRQGDDLIIKLEDGEITLKGAAKLSTVNINGVLDEPLNVTSKKDGVSLVGGVADDSINNIGSNVTVKTFGGNDTIHNFVGVSLTAIDAGAGNDYITNGGKQVTINAGDGNDSIYNGNDSSNVIIDAGNGDDFVSNSGSNVTINAGNGDDSVRNEGSNVTINAGAGDDSITNLRNGTNSLLLGGEGNDSIANGQAQATLDGGKGNDYIYNDGNDVTINGSTGDDTIQNNGLAGYGDNVIFQYKAGDGNDVVQGFKANSTLSISGGISPDSIKDGDDLIVTVGDGKITLQGAAKLSAVNIVETPVNIHNSDRYKLVTATNANDTIINTGGKATINALRGDDSINNNAAEVSINAGEGNDSISNTGKFVKINPQKGDDNIYNNAANVTIRGESGNHSVFSHGKDVEIYGSAGKDTIENYTDSNEVIISSGAGDDSIKNAGNKVTIQGLDGNDTISSKGTSNSVLGGAGNDLISLSSSYKNTVIGGAGDDTITLDWNSNNALIKHDKGDGNDIIEGFNATSTLQLGNGNASYNKSTEGDDVIVTVEGETITLKGAATLSKLNIDGLTKLNVNNTLNAVALTGGRLEDKIINSGGKVTISTFAGEDTIENRGSRAIIDAGSEKDSISNINADNVSINSGEGSDFVSVINSKGVTVDAGEDSDTDGDVISVNGGFRNVIYGKDSRDTVINRKSNNGTIFGGADNDSIANIDSDGVSIDAGEGDDVITLSGGFRNTILGGKGKDSIYLSQNETDLLIKHEKGDGNDIIYGFNENSTLQLGDGNDTFLQTVKGNDIIIITDNGTITLANAANLSGLNIFGRLLKGNNIYYNSSNTKIIGTAGDDSIKGLKGSGNNTILAYAGDDYIENRGASSTIDGGAGNDSIYNRYYADNVTINGGSGNDSISNEGDTVTINGSEDNDYIDNWGSGIKIDGGAGNDSISNAGDSVTINAGEGDDLINNTNANAYVLYNYTSGDGNDTIQGFKETSTLCIANSDFTTARYFSNIIVRVGEDRIMLKDAAKLSNVNIIKDTREFPLNIANAADDVSIVGTSLEDTISNKGANVTISAADGNDTISNTASNVTIDGGAGSDSIVNDYGFYSSIAGGEGNDFITVLSSSQATINAGKADDVISLRGNDETLIEYNAGDGNDKIYGFDEMSTLNIVKSEFTSSTTDNGDIVVNVGSDKITIDGGATLSNPNITSGTHITFTIKNSAVTCDTDVPESVIKDAYRFNKELSLLTINGDFKDYSVTVKNDEASSVKVALNNYGSANLNSGSTLEYKLEDGKINATLLSKNYDDQITFSEDADFNYGKIQAEVFKNSTVTTKGAKKISFDNDSTADVTAPRDYQIVVDASNILVNDLPINAKNGSGTVTVTKKGLSIEGYGVQQFADLEIAKKSYFGKLAPMTVTYDSREEIYTVYNTADVKTLSSDFVKVKFDFRDDTKAQTANDEKYAYYKVNDVAIMLAKDLDNAEVVEVNGRTFKVQGEELDAEKIGRITLDEQLSFSGTVIDYNGVKTTYAQNKPVSYSADGKEITISDAATLTTDDNTKTFKCEAGSYVINGKSFKTSADLTFTADKGAIKIPLSDANTEIYFDGVKVSGISDGGELVFNLANGKISVPNGATLNLTSPDEIKLNLAAGSFTIDGKKISVDSELEITADKDKIKVPLGEKPVTINGAAITGAGEMIIDNTNADFFSIRLPDGALVESVSDNIFELKGKDSSAYFGDANKKVLLTEDDTAYIKFEKENKIGVGVNSFALESAEISGVDAWTVETAGANGIGIIKGIKGGATIATSTESIDAGDLRFEVETDGAGEVTICGEKFTSTDKNTYVVFGNSKGEIKVAPKGEEYTDDDSEPEGKIYEFATAGIYTINGITFYAEKGAKAQTITRGVEFDLSTGIFQYEGLTLEGAGTTQISRYNAGLISLTDGAIIKGDDESKYYNRQFEIEGAVEIIGKKFETDQLIRCGLISVQVTTDGKTLNAKGFAIGGEYVLIQDDCYDSVKIVDKKIKSIEGVKDSAEISGNGLSNVSIMTTETGEFSINGKTYSISEDSDGVIFVKDSHGNVSEIKGLQGAIEGSFENEIIVNGKAVRLTGASMIKVTSDGESITEISNVASDLVTTDGKTYRKDIRVYESGGAEKLTTSTDGTIIFSGNKFETSAGKTFTLDDSGNVSGIEKSTVETSNATSYARSFYDTDEETSGAINLSETDGLEEVFGDFSEGLTVNGVFVKVTDSTNFVVKNDDENIYIETTAPDVFTINGKSFETYADKTIFKLNADGNVCEIVTDKFYLYPDSDSYLIEGDFSEEIIFNGKKFCVTGSHDTSVFIGDETLIYVELAKNAVKVVESGGADEIALSGAGEITVGEKTFSTSEDFIGFLGLSSEGSAEKVIDLVGTLSGKLGGLEFEGSIIDSEDTFSVTSDGEKISAIENLNNGSFTCGNFEGVMINGVKVSVDNSEEVKLTITDGELEISELMNSANVSNSGGKVNYVTKESGEFFIGEDNFKVTGDDSVTFAADENGKVNEISDLAENASLQTAFGGEVVVNGKTLTAKDKDILVGSSDSAKIFGAKISAEEILEMFTGDSKKIVAANGRATIKNYDYKKGEAFITEYENIAEAIEENSIAFDDGRLTVNSATIILDNYTDSGIIYFIDKNDNLQKVGFADDDSAIDASKESGSFILFGGSGSTLRGGTGKNQIYLKENGESTIALNGRNTIHNFNLNFDDGDKISVDATTAEFKFDGSDLTVKSGEARALLENISSDNGVAKVLTVADGKEIKTAIAQKGTTITAGDELADIYIGNKSGVDFTGFEESLIIDLSDGKSFRGINQITVGGGLNTVIGSTANETLTGNADGIAEFVFDKGNGRDVIKNFNFEEDKINVGTNAITAVNLNDVGAVRMQIDGDGWITLEDAQGKNFRINDFTALVDKNIEYNDAANYFVATSKKATVTVNDEAEIWLDGSHGKYFVGYIKTLDATNSDSKNTLAGNAFDNTILAGKGDASLWGGNGGDDLLVGGNSQNLFFYCAGNGNDTIRGTNDGDGVILADVSLDQIVGTKIYSNAVDINFKDGGSLRVEGNSDVTYQLADGSTYSADHEQAVWLTK